MITLQIVSGVSDQISILLFGSNETDNDLAREKVRQNSLYCSSQFDLSNLLDGSL
jgi:hypothetical protein